MLFEDTEPRGKERFEGSPTIVVRALSCGGIGLVREIVRSASHTHVSLALRLDCTLNSHTRKASVDALAKQPCSTRSSRTFRRLGKPSRSRRVTCTG